MFIVPPVERLCSAFVLMSIQYVRSDQTKFQPSMTFSKYFELDRFFYEYFRVTNKK
jgi:hypothetical protein